MYEAIQDMDSTYRDARAPRNDLEYDIESDDLFAVDGLDENVYDTKIAQFEAELTAFDDVEAILQDFREGIDALLDARRAASNGNDEEGRDRANDAEGLLGDAADDLEDLADDLPDDGESFEDVLLESADVAVDKQDEARGLY